MTADGKGAVGVGLLDVFGLEVAKAGLGFHRASTGINQPYRFEGLVVEGHTLLLSRAGFVLAFGKNENGQLGTNDKKTRTGATRITFVRQE